MEYDDDDNDGPGMVLLRLGGSSPILAFDDTAVVVPLF